MSKTMIVAVALLVASVCSALAATRLPGGPKIDGKWSGQIPRPNNSFDAIFEFQAEGQKLTGTVNANGDQFEIVDGQIKSDTISFRIGSTAGTYSGKVSGDEIAMKVVLTGGEFGSRTMDFTLKRMARPG
jgi:hypothetical protein